ncbi:MAG TPA: TlpA disulfide reductase family protein [Blastocatellia bacterium]|nr:TlpA disulfide reductase family protein [Blastocatellia bacterium]
MSNSIQRLNIKSKVRANAVAVFLISICFLGLLTMAGCGGNNQETANSVPDYVIPTTDGQKIQLSQYRGKVVVVDFWAPWCGPCRAETPHLVKIANDYKDKGVVVIGLSIPDPRTQDGQVEQFVKDFKINYTIGFAPDGMFEKFDSVGDGPIPQTLVFGRDGRKILQTAGFDPMQDGEKLQRAVQQAVSGQPARS